MTLVEVTDADGVRLIRWNRPDALNAFNDEVWDATRDALVRRGGRPRAALRRAHRAPVGPSRPGRTSAR